MGKQGQSRERSEAERPTSRTITGAMNVLCSQLGTAARRAVRKFSAWLLLAAVIVLSVGVSEAFIAPSASLPLASAPKIDGHSSRGCDTRPSNSRSSSSSGGFLSMSGDDSTAQAEPMKVSALLYTYVDGMVDKRAPYRSDHLDLLKTMTEEGTCLLGGAFLEPCDGAILLFSSPDHAQNFVDKDPYNTGGLVTKYQIRDYMAVVGTMLKK